MNLEFKLMADAFQSLHRQPPRCVCCGLRSRDVKVRGGDLLYAEYCLACYEDPCSGDGEPCRHGQRPDEEEER